MDGYVPGWASGVDQVDKYNESMMEWVSQKRKDLFHSDESEKSVISTVPSHTTAADKTKEPETKESPIKPVPLKNTDSTTNESKQDSKPISKATGDIKESTPPVKGDDKKAKVTESEKVTKEPTVEQKIVTESGKPQEIKHSAVDTNKDKLSAAKDTEKVKEPVGNTEPSLVKCLEEFTEACGTVVDSNLMLSKTMEKARGDIALVLLQPSPDYEKLAELEKTIAETTASLKTKIEENYSSYCSAYQILLGVVKEATDTGLVSLVSEAQQSIFEQSVVIQSAEDRVRINEAIDSAFTNFIATVKSTESELTKELAELDAPANVKAGLEDTAVLLLAERRVKLLYDKLKQLSPDEIAKSLEKQRAELAKLYEEKMHEAMDESRADMQQRIEAKVRFYFLLK